MSPSVLYDMPGPKARRLALIGTIVSVLVGLALLAVGLKRLADNGQFEADKWCPLLNPSDADFSLVAALNERPPARARKSWLVVLSVIGAVVVDQHGTAHGTVTSVELNPASDLLVLDDGGLVPLTFVVGQAEGRIEVEVPAGLLD